MLSLKMLFKVSPEQPLSVFKILVETPPRFLFEPSSMRFKMLSSRFSSGFSPRPSHESPGVHVTGVADAKKFHRVLTVTTRKAKL